VLVNTLKKSRPPSKWGTFTLKEYHSHLDVLVNTLKKSRPPSKWGTFTLKEYHSHLDEEGAFNKVDEHHLNREL
jgi:hypothetical protein